MTDYLITMRLMDMRRMHPSQDNTRVCSHCREPVGLYPTGQRALLRDPQLRIMCSRCWKPNGTAEHRPAGSFDEIMQEIRDSREAREQ
jgi:hypothetical protein